MCYYILEVCKKDGAEFPPNTLHHICCGIMRFTRTNGMNVGIFKDKEFADCHAVLDSEMKRLQAAGQGTTQKRLKLLLMMLKRFFGKR